MMDIWNGQHRARLIKSARYPRAEAIYSISQAGIIDVEV
jgi:hypothetical protein